MNDQRHLERKQRRFCSSDFKERHKCRHPLTSLRVQRAFQTHTYWRAQSPLQMSQHHYHAVSIPGEDDPHEFQSGWM